MHNSGKSCCEKVDSRLSPIILNVFSAFKSASDGFIRPRKTKSCIAT
jgi:hypothetical protein